MSRPVERVALAVNLSATPAGKRWHGGKAALLLSATFGGGNVVLEVFQDTTSAWLPVSGSLTANGLTVYDLPPGVYRPAITTATAVFAELVGIPE